VTQPDPEGAARWRRLTELFEQALACPADERAAFIARAAASDASLRTELESLLAAHRRPRRR
jgi:hypothetical protein